MRRLLTQRMMTSTIVLCGMTYALYALLSGHALSATLAWFAVASVCVAAIASPGWFDEAPETWQTRRRDNLRMNGGSYTDREWQALCREYNFCCARCGRRRRLTVDHVIPVSKGGSSDISNLQPLCRPCNSLKGARIVDYRHAVKQASRVQCTTCRAWFDSRAAYNGHLRTCKS